MSIEKQHFGVYNRSREISKYTLKNSNGIEVQISDLGATILSIKTPDKYRRYADIVCGYDDIDSYIKASGYQGAIIGRVANRIGNGHFKLDGVDHNLYKNDGANHLHGGKIGFDKRIWSVLSENGGDEPSLKLFLLSRDGEEGYPGDLRVTVTYKLDRNNELSIHYEAISNKRTIINLTNHTYFNLNGYDSGSIYDHILWLDADTYLPTDPSLIPTGEIKSVDGGAFDFRIPKTIGRDIDTRDKDLELAGGYDHCFNFRTDTSNYTKLRARVIHRGSGRAMDMMTDQPCVQFYSGNFLGDAEFPFKNGCQQVARMAFCLETQHMPDSINHKGFTNTILEPGDIYDHTTIYKFYIE